MPLPIYVGFDSRESRAFQVTRASLLAHASRPLRIRPLAHRALRACGLFDRPWTVDGPTGQLRDLRDGRPMATEFAHSRFLVPVLASCDGAAGDGDGGGWALFCDCDFLFREDVADLFALADPRCAVMVVKHEQTVVAPQKMDGMQQHAYPRKNWSSLVLWNLRHELNRELTRQVVNHSDGRWLHGFGWLPDSAIGALPERWNWLALPGRDEPAEPPAAIHYTEGGPWFPGFEGVPYAGAWTAAALAAVC